MILRSAGGALLQFFRDDGFQIFFEYLQARLVQSEQSFRFDGRTRAGSELFNQLSLGIDDPPSRLDVARRHFTAALGHVTSLAYPSSARTKLHGRRGGARAFRKSKLLDSRRQLMKGSSIAREPRS